VNNEGIESLQGLQTSSRDGDEVSIIPALAGGGQPSPGAGQPTRGAGQLSPGLIPGTDLTPEEYARIQAQAIAEYPSECCRVVMARPSTTPERLLLACRNIQDELHSKDPKRILATRGRPTTSNPRDLIAMGRREAEVSRS